MNPIAWAASGVADGWPFVGFVKFRNSIMQGTVCEHGQSGQPCSAPAHLTVNDTSTTV